ncbi:MAG TPA: ABC transporter permease [Hypericibacter adhaerens]|jgi:ribose/xylose/arabinose/galactoside ABC-type transport system permease subunit|uniref:ABC transporter permease n=1 Tax=Hypericibacter adhaerens TaxID=2602016 RepID=UPI002B7DE504|nr:ABC transporter permease [Hypericibacter adhaerens]HWA45589.1 ABC transporter permease [Hypericibacter adhaerens]
MASTAIKPKAAAPWRARTLVLKLLQVVGILALLLIVGLAAATPGFFTIANFQAVLASTTFVGLVAIGMTLIMISGAFVSMSLATTGTVTAMFFVFALQFGLVPAVLMTVALGAILGLLQGLAIGAWDANPIIVTIAAGSIQEGLSVAISGGTTISPVSDSYAILNITPLGLPLGFYLLLLLVVVTELILRGTRLGREIYMLGESRAAARAAALPLGRIGASVFCLAGVTAALTGILLAAFNHSASLLLNRGTLNYDAIAATLIGGAAIAGGRGAVWRTLGGVIIIAFATDLVLLRGYSTGTQILLKGLVMMVFVLALHLRSKERRR